MFKEIREKWNTRLTMNNLVGTENTDYLEAMHQLSEEAQNIWENMYKYELGVKTVDTRTELWPGYESDKVSKYISYSFQNLKKMATAYQAEGSTLYKNEKLRKDILLGLDWMNANRYHENIGTVYDNWWDFNIGGAQALVETLALMKDEMSQAQLDSYYAAIQHFNEDPTISVGIYENILDMNNANLLDKLLVTALTGIIYESEDHMELASQLMCSVLPYVTSGNGFYEDGSYIDHSTVPYAGGYGGVLMSGLSKLLYITDETPWEVTDPLLENAYEWIINAFEPLYYKGAIMDMVNGRGISRHNSSDHDKGKGLLHKMLELSQTAPELKKTQIQAFIKENIINDTMCEEYFKGVNTNDTIMIKALLEDDRIIARGDLTLHKVYGAMDRVVHHRPGYSLGISMFSTRISAYEVGNGENLKPWHTSDGMTYLYNDDHEQFTKDFWPTVDPMRLPGITTDHSERAMKDWYNYHSTQDWVGGSELHGLYGAAGMAFEMEPVQSTLSGKKSWFSFDDEIVALGAGITASDNRLVETIIENRKIKDSGDNLITVDGENRQPEMGTSQVKKAKWAHLSGNTEAGTDAIGYYLPDQSNLTITREARTGSWSEINKNGPTTPITKNYVSIAIEHGNNPTSADYSYVLLPNKSVEKVENYSQKADIKILANTDKVQAVRENTLGVTGMNFWQAAELEGIRAKNPSSVMMEEKDNTLHLALSDPTHKQDKIIIILDQGDYQVVSKSDTIQVENKGKELMITVNTKGALGKSHTLELIKAK